ncbi:MAG: TonB-dependent receptor [Gemmatimonadetes bacterium]|nr:TonB-dependent receptor [Gemmatimonadota bacterium]
MYAAREGRAAAGPIPLIVGLCLGWFAHPGLAQVSPDRGPARSDSGQVRPDSDQASGDWVDALSLEGLVVTAAPTALEEEAVSSHVTVIDGEALRHFSSGSLADALRDASGVHVVRGGSFGAVTSLFLRGGESDYTLVLVDGVQVNQAGGGFDLAELGTEAIERVEILRGPASALYGSDAVSGVIHVITRTGRGAPVASVAMEGGSFGRQNVSAELRAGTERASYGLSLARRSTDGIFDLNNQSLQTVLSGVGRFRPDDRTSLEVNVRASDRTYHFPTNSAGAAVDENAFTFSDGTTARVSATRRITSRLSVEATVAMNEFDSGTDDAPDSPADTLGFYGFTSLDHFRRSEGELRGHLRLDQFVLTTGIEYEEERQRSFSESLSQFGPSPGRSRNERENLGYFLHATGEAGGVSYQVGGRVEDNERFGVRGSWEAGLAGPLPGFEGGTFRASVGTAIKEPTFFETFASGFTRGNPDLDPERSLAWEVGAESRLAGFATVGVTYFDQTFEDLIQYTFSPPDPTDPNYFNVAAATSRGVEVDVDMRHGWWSGSVSGSWMDTEVTDSGFDDGLGATFVEGEALLRRPSWKGTAQVAANVGRLEVSTRIAHVGSRQDRDFSTFPATPVLLESYQLLSGRLSVVVVEPGPGRPGLSLSLAGENLGDARYRELFGFPTPGRGLYMGGQIVLGG